MLIPATNSSAVDAQCRVVLRFTITNGLKVTSVSFSADKKKFFKKHTLKPYIWHPLKVIRYFSDEIVPKAAWLFKALVLHQFVWDRSLYKYIKFRDNSLIRERQWRIFNLHQQSVPADVSSDLTFFQWTVHTSMPHPDSETPRWQFIAGSRFGPMPDSFEVSMHTSRPSCQPIYHGDHIARVCWIIEGAMQEFVFGIQQQATPLDEVYWPDQPWSNGQCHWLTCGPSNGVCLEAVMHKMQCSSKFTLQLCIDIARMVIRRQSHAAKEGMKQSWFRMCFF